MAATVAASPTASDVTIDVLTGSTLAAITSIAGTGLPELVAAMELNDQPPTGWDETLIADPSWVYVVVTAEDGVVEVVGLTLRCQVEGAV